jgi:hypothetical protein
MKSGGLPTPSESALERRIAASLPDRTGDDLDAQGYAVAGSLLTPEECRELSARYGDSSLFRKRVVMARHGFGRGEYSYFAEPLPAIVASLRRALYAKLVPIANGWWERLGHDERFPVSFEQYARRSEAAGQRLPTPLLLHYAPGDYNCLHQDLYGSEWFPLQTAILLDEPGRDFEGGELVLVEQRPRMQSRAAVVPLRQGDAVVFPCHHRPHPGKRGYYRTTVKHGVSEVRRGMRHTLGIIFHGAAS